VAAERAGAKVVDGTKLYLVSSEFLHPGSSSTWRTVSVVFIKSGMSLACLWQRFENAVEKKCKLEAIKCVMSGKSMKVGIFSLMAESV